MKMKIEYKDLGLGSTIKGRWVFEFQASGETLNNKIQTFSIGKEFTLNNGQSVVVNELILTPVSTTINYQIYSREKYNYEYDVRLMIEDETGKRYAATSERTLGENSYFRFEAIDEKISKLKITPYLISGKEGIKKTDYYEVLKDEAFEVELK